MWMQITIKRRVAYRAIGGLALALLIATLACSLTDRQADDEVPVVTPSPTPPEDAPAEDDDSAAPPEPPAAPEQAEGQGQGPLVRVTGQLNVREGPSTDCPILGFFPQNAEVPVLARSPDGGWYQVNVGAETGWMSASYTTPIGDLSGVPTLSGPACEAAPPPSAEPPEEPPPPPQCGDGTCDPDESFATCPGDCQTCGNGACDSGENFSSCPGDCDTCGNATCDAGESYGNCPGDCKCGNAVCDSGEDATWCPGDCKCGNGSCESDIGEDSTTCSADCLTVLDPGLVLQPGVVALLEFCGNGTCAFPDETCSTCAADCGACCGNFLSDPGEVCDPPGQICGMSGGFPPQIDTCSADCTACN